MSITISGSTVTFNDGSTQTTTGTPPSYDSVGSTLMAYYIPASSVNADVNVAGSNLRFRPTSSYPHNTTDIWSLTDTVKVQYGYTGISNMQIWSFNQQSGGNSTWRDPAAAYLAGGGSSLSGTWKKLTPQVTYSSAAYSYGTAYYWYPALWRRVS